MNFRPVGALVLVLATAAGVPAAHAAAKPLCQIVTDDTGDTFVARAQDGTKPGPQEDGFDITSADVASDGKVVTAVIRVKTLTTSIQTSPVGVGYSFDFLSPTSTMQASLRAVYITGQAPYFEATYKDPSVPNSPSTFLGLAKGFADAKTKSVHITAPLSLFAGVLGTMKKGTKIFPAADAATTGRAVPPSPGTAGQPVATRFVFADVAAGGKAIAVGQASCVKPGK
jgi:hypothetical protein